MNGKHKYGSKGKSFQIFLVDDDTEDQEFFIDALSATGESVELSIFDSGTQLFDAISNTVKKPDMIYIDLHMPLMDGEECLKVLRKDDSLKAVPVIIYSTALDLDKIGELFSMGANRYLRKPNSFNSLVASLSATISSLKRNALGGNAVINIDA